MFARLVGVSELLTPEEQLGCPKDPSTDYDSSRPRRQLYRAGIAPRRRASDFHAGSEAAVPDNAVDGRVGPQRENIRPRCRGRQVRRQGPAALAVAKHVGSVTKSAVLLVGALVGNHVLPARGVEAGREGLVPLVVVQLAVLGGVPRAGDARKDAFGGGLDVAVLPARRKVVVEILGVGLSCLWLDFWILE